MPLKLERSSNYSQKKRTPLQSDKISSSLNQAKPKVRSFHQNTFCNPTPLTLLVASPPQKEEQSTNEKDPEEQVDKAPPTPPAPSESSKKSGGIPPEVPRETKKDVGKVEKDSSKGAAEKPSVAGTRNETRVGGSPTRSREGTALLTLIHPRSK